MRRLSLLLALLSVALVSRALWREPPRPELPSVGDWASTPLICRTGAVAVTDTGACRGAEHCVPVRYRVTWNPEGGEAWRDEEHVRRLSLTEVQAILAQLAPLERRRSDLFPCSRFSETEPPSITVFRHCDAANRTLVVQPLRREWGRTRCGEPRCGGEPLDYVSCLAKENWVEVQRTSQYDRVEVFARQLRAAL